MLNLAGRPMRGKAGDAEGLTLERANDLHGPVIVSFERNVRVWRYDLSKGFSAPSGERRRSATGFSRSRTMRSSKRSRCSSPTRCWCSPSRDSGPRTSAARSRPIRETDRANTRRLSVVPHDPFSMTGAANAPDGGIFILERRYSLIGGRGHGIAPCRRERSARRRAARRRRAGQPLVPGCEYRQHGRLRGTPRTERRDAALSDLRQQFLDACSARCS